ncbi:MAG: DnaB-like helicase C-terminal domain-containing protein [Rubripirellula sp.]
MNKISQSEASEGLLAGLLLDPQLIPVVSSKIESGDFTDANHGGLFDLVCNMHHAGESVRDGALVIARLRESGLLSRIGGVKKFKEAFLNAEAVPNVHVYADQIRRDSVAGKLSALSTRFLHRTMKGDDPLTLAQWMRYELEAIEAKASTDSHISTMGDACRKLIGDVATTLVSGKSPAVETGIDFLDATYGGLLPSRLCVVAARPGAGKSSIAQQVGEGIAAANRGAHFVSLEMSRDEVAARYLARKTGINGKYIANHLVNETELRRLTEAAQSCELPFTISEPSGKFSTVEAICAEARVQATSGNMSVLIVDYLQIVEPSDPKQREYDKVTLATRAFKQLSRELRVPVVLLSQLSRKGEDGKEAGRPKLSHLRSSGSIEQDADAVIFLHAEPDGTVSLIVEKMRGGERGETKLTFHGPTCTFRDVATEDMPNHESGFDQFNRGD